jgi:hypothetical protein
MKSLQQPREKLRYHFPAIIVERSYTCWECVFDNNAKVRFQVKCYRCTRHMWVEKNLKKKIIIKRSQSVERETRILQLRLILMSITIGYLFEHWHLPRWSCNIHELIFYYIYYSHVIFDSYHPHAGDVLLSLSLETI